MNGISEGGILMKADYIFYNGPVITVDSRDSVREGVAIANGIIIKVGTKEDVMQLRGETTEMIDLKGRSLIPGFIDSHLHTAVMGANALALDLRWPGVGSIEEIKDKIREAAKTVPKGQWIRGWGYDHSKLKEQRHPNKWDLDEAAPEHPVMLTRVCAHISAHNSMSLNFAGVDENTVCNDPSTMEKIDGVYSGVMKENAHMAMMKVASLSKEEIIRAMEAANQMLVSEGITSVHDSGGYGAVQMEAFQEAVEQGKFHPRLYTMIFSFVENVRFVEDYLSVGIHTGFGNPHLRLGPVKLMIDGSSSGPTAATLAPYASNPSFSGILSHTQEEIDAIIEKAHGLGWQVTSHAVGDRAVTMIVDAIEKALLKCPREDHRHRIEHCAMVNDALLERIKALGIVPIPNPIFLYEFGDGYLKNYGNERAHRMFPSKSYFDRGILAAGSSDCPITFSNPIRNMSAAVNRKTQTGQVVNGAEGVSVAQALRMFTIHGAYASFEEKHKGSIEEGKLADLVVLSGSLYETSPVDLEGLSVDMTLIDGKVVYKK
jgi:predicted amidohydrolase YtcJ